MGKNIELKSETKFENLEDQSFRKNLFFVTLIVFSFIAYGIFSYYKVVETYFYKEVSATVLAEEIYSYRGSKGKMHYVPRIIYKYEMGGANYTNDAYRPIFETVHENRAKEILANYKPNEKIKVYVNPENPQQSYMVKGFIPEYILSPSIFYCALFAWLILIYMFVSKNYIAIKSSDSKHNVSFIFAKPTPIGFGLLVVTIGSFLIGLIIMWTESIYRWDMVTKLFLSYIGLFLLGFWYRIVNKEPFRKYELIIKETLDPNQKFPKTNYKNIAFLTIFGILIMSFLIFLYSAKY